MKHLLKLEMIGDDTTQFMRLQAAKLNAMVPGLGKTVVGNWPNRNWVARITGGHPKYRWERKFLPFKKDYTNANSKGSRGVEALYMLESPYIYEVNAPVSWKKCDRYFCRIDDDGELIRLTEDEVAECLKTD